MPLQVRLSTEDLTSALLLRHFHAVDFPVDATRHPGDQLPLARSVASQSNGVSPNSPNRPKIVEV